MAVATRIASAHANRTVIAHRDREILRALAERVATLATRPEEEAKRRLWTSHNSLKPGRPLVHCDPENGWHEIIADDALKCQGKLARSWEFTIRREIFWGDSMGDDRVVEPYIDVPYVCVESDWGMHENRIGGADGSAYTWGAPLKDYADLEKLRFPQIVVDHEATGRLVRQASETFGGTLKVRVGGWWWSSLGLTDVLARLRGLEKVMLDVYDCPKELHRLMGILRDGTLAKLDFLEERGLLALNTDTCVGSGGFGYTTELPQAGFDSKRVRPQDMWGFCESQETVTFSPQMFAEFILPYQLPIMERFGLNCYGCCEPLNARWDEVRKTPRLRRVSVSPWADLADMAEKLGDRYVYSLKPHPGVLAVTAINEERVRADLREALQCTRGCRVEIIMKDNHTIGNNPRNVIDWCRIAREEAEAV